MTRQPFLIRCEPCQHVWAIAYLPMEMGTMVKLLKRAACPLCGSSGKNLFLATAKDAESLMRDAQQDDRDQDGDAAAGDDPGGDPGARRE